MKRLSSKYKFFLLLGLYVVIFFIWQFFIASYFDSKLETFDKKIHEITNFQKKQPLIAKESSEINRIIDSLKEETVKFRGRASSIKSMGSVGRSFKSFTRKYGLKTDNFSPLFQIFYQKQEDFPDKEFLNLPVNVHITGKFKNFVTMLENLNRFPQVISVGSPVQIIPYPGRENVIDVTMVLNIMVKTK